VASAAVGTGLGNYTISYVDGQLTVNRKPLTITATNQAKTFGATFTPNGTTQFATGAGQLVNGNTVASVTLTSTGYPAGAAVGGHPIVPTAAVGTGLGNYTITYANGTLSVVYLSTGTCLGEGGHQILQPVNADGTSVVKKNSTVPAKFRVCDANGNSVGTAGVVTDFRLIQTLVGTVATDVNETVVATTPDAAFRWDPSAQQWIFNINTKVLMANQTYVYRITLNDGSTIDFKFGVR
jgi:hypothetical protein